MDEDGAMTFPVLKNQDIVACLQDMGVPADISMIKDPKVRIFLRVRHKTAHYT